MENKCYGGIDYFRVIAAILVISIHTLPFASINAEADLIFTRIIGRVAVPFFFMTTGFFLFPEDTNWNNVKKFFIKIGKLYILSIIIYLPLNLYAKHYTASTGVKEILVDVLVDGTVYHLWYFPAVMLGVLLVACLLNYFSKKSSFLITLSLYMMGVLGDSYYGFLAHVSPIEQIYQGYFSVFDYTRNGLFFAPIFILIGALIHGKEPKNELKVNAVGLVVSLSAMILEGVLLDHYQIPRHDSMYMMLIPVMYFLYQILLVWKVGNRSILRPLSLWIYIIHPWVIVFIRGGASAIGLKPLLVENQLVNFVVVTILSILSVWSWLHNDKRFKADHEH